MKFSIYIFLSAIYKYRKNKIKKKTKENQHVICVTNLIVLYNMYYCYIYTLMYKENVDILFYLILLFSLVYYSKREIVHLS